MVVRPPLAASLPSRRVALVAVVIVTLLLAAVGYALFVHVPVDRNGTRIDALSVHGKNGPSGPYADQYVATSYFKGVNRSAESHLVIRAVAWHGSGERRASTVTRSVLGSENDTSSVVERFYNGTVQFTRRTVPRDERFDLETARYRSRNWRVAADRPNRTIYTRNDQSADAILWYPRIAPLILDILEYRRVGTTTIAGHEVVIYEPVTGWVTRGAEFRQYVSAASGRVFVDPDDRTVVRADVAVTAIQADRWAGVLTQPRLDLEFHYRLHPTDAVAVDRPGWTSRVENGTATG